LKDIKLIVQTSISKSYLVIDRCGFFGADVLAIHRPIPITDISKIIKSCFLLHCQKYHVFNALYFFQKLQKSGFMS